MKLSPLQEIRLKRYLGLTFKIALTICVVIGLGWSAFDYVVRLPKERSQFNRGVSADIKLGFDHLARASLNSMTAPESDPKTTKLPVVELFIQGNDLDSLSQNLPESGASYKRVLVRVDGRVRKARARLRGDSLNHWSFPYKSWRIRLREARLYEGMEIFNLYLPRTKTQVNEVLGYKLAEIAGGIISPRAFLGHFRLNRQFDGVRMVLEQINSSTPERFGKRSGKIFNGDIDAAHIYGKKKRQALFSPENARHWTVDSPPVDVGAIDGAPPPSKSLVRLLQAVKFKGDKAERSRLLRESVDYDAYAKFIAILDLFTSTHIDNTHNQKLYLNPDTGLFEPIFWDPIPFRQIEKKRIDAAPNDLFGALLEDENFYHLKTKALWDLVSNKLPLERVLEEYDQIVESARPDILASVYKLIARNNAVHVLTNEDWEKNVVQLRGQLKAHWAATKSRLSSGSVTYSVQPTAKGFKFSIQPKANAGVVLDRVTIAECQKAVELRRIAGHNTEIPCKNGSAEIQLSELLLPKTRRKGMAVRPIDTRFDFEIVGKSSVPLITAIHPLTGEQLKFSKTDDLSSLTQGSWNLAQPPKRTEIGGTRIISSSVVVNRGEELVITPGSTLKLKPGVSLLVRGGKLTAKGIPGKRIRIENAERESFGVLGIIRGSADLQNVDISGGSYSYFDEVFLPRVLSAEGSDLTIIDSTIQGPIKFANSTVLTDRTNIVGSGELIENHKSKINGDFELVRKPSLLTPVALEGKALGTPPRTEREFKFQLTRGNQISVKDVALEIHNALSEGLKNPDLWKAPKITKTDYGIGDSERARAYVDYYMDTEDLYALKSGLSYRLRYRFNSARRFFQHRRFPSRVEFWPYRAEFQFKRDPKDLGNGLSSVIESRFEFRQQSEPFGPSNLPPPPPWLAEELIEYMQTGLFRGVPTYPGQEAAKAFLVEGKSAATLAPKIVIVTSRRRSHLNLKTPYGSGPNPDQAFIITLDDGSSYDALKLLACRENCNDSPLEQFLELEVEFERNVSTKFEQEHSKQRDELEELNNALLEDQNTILQIISSRLNQKGIALTPSTGSKYNQGFKRKLAGS